MSDRMMELLKFTSSDLDYNRSGMLSPEQQARISGSRRITKLVVLIAGLILLAVAAVLALFLATRSVSGALIGAALVGGCVGLPGLIAVILGLKPASKITIEKVQGTAKVARVQHTSTVDTSGVTRQYTVTEMHIGGRVFPLADEAFSELEDGAEYALYTWKGTDNIFSMEKL